MTTLVIGSTVKELRVKSGLSQQALADMAGIDRKTVNRIENGHFMPSIETLLALGEALGTSSSRLLGS